MRILGLKTESGFCQDYPANDMMPMSCKVKPSMYLISGSSLGRGGWSKRPGPALREAPSLTLWCMIYFAHIDTLRAQKVQMQHKLY
jgi:hypothetical protein